METQVGTALMRFLEDQCTYNTCLVPIFQWNLPVLLSQDRSTPSKDAGQSCNHPSGLFLGLRSTCLVLITTLNMDWRGQK